MGCRYCDKEVSPYATVCPHCGQPDPYVSETYYKDLHKNLPVRPISEDWYKDPILRPIVFRGGFINMVCLAVVLIASYVLFPAIRGVYVFPLNLGTIAVVIICVLLSFGAAAPSAVTGDPNRWVRYFIGAAVISAVVAMLSRIGILHWFCPWDPRW